jgi:hypothetical protein
MNCFLPLEAEATRQVFEGIVTTFLLKFPACSLQLSDKFVKVKIAKKNLGKKE